MISILYCYHCKNRPNTTLILDILRAEENLISLRSLLYLGVNVQIIVIIA